MNANIILLDNFDSFTYNLVDQFRSDGNSVTIYRNSISAAKIMEKIAQTPNAVLVLSPGPGTPKQAGCLLELIGMARGKVPMIGICLGHQALIEQFGGEVGSAGEILHGKASSVEHCGKFMFLGLPQPLPVARYHSLMGTKISDSLQVIATYQNIPMAVINQQEKVVGLQFHPESILTTHGATLLQKTLQWALQKEEK